MSALANIIGNDPFLQFILWCVLVLVVISIISYGADRGWKNMIGHMEREAAADLHEPNAYDELQARIAKREKAAQQARRASDKGEA